MILMADLNNEIRLAVDTGKVEFGLRSSIKSISDAKALAVVVAEKGKKEYVDDLIHMCNIANVKLIRFSGNSVELGALCGKPFSINALAVIEPGNSGIVNY